MLNRVCHVSTRHQSVTPTRLCHVWRTGDRGGSTELCFTHIGSAAELGSRFTCWSEKFVSKRVRKVKYWNWAFRTASLTCHLDLQQIQAPLSSGKPLQLWHKKRIKVGFIWMWAQVWPCLSSSLKPHDWEHHQLKLSFKLTVPQCAPQFQRQRLKWSFKQPLRSRV